MINKENKNFYAFFLAMYIAFTIRSYLQKATWFFDGIFAIILITVLYIISANLKMKKTEFILANISMITHLAGFFGLYALGFGFFQYDNFIHIVGACAASWITFNFFVKTFEKDKRTKHLFDEHKVFLIFLIFSIAFTLGLFIELAEFGGFLYLGHGDGLFFVGSGDTDGNSIYGNYTDTMDDIVSNLIGASLGVFLYHKIRYKKLKS